MDLLICGPFLERCVVHVELSRLVSAVEAVTGRLCGALPVELLVFVDEIRVRSSGWWWLLLGILVVQDVLDALDILFESLLDKLNTHSIDQVLPEEFRG